MRFEVKAGGVVAILMGLAALSGAVFLMGLRAGYDIAHESQTDADKVATDYPLTVTPPSSAAPAPGAQTPAASASSGLVEGPVPDAPEQPAAASTAVAHQPPPAATRPALASNPPPPRNPVARPKPPRVIAPPVPADLPPEGLPPPEEPVAVPVTAPPAHPGHKPFNIEIQAAMDSTSANQMVKRLQALGYRPHLAPTPINGATWYKVEVGPYATQAEAATAEAELRQKYNGTYGRGGAPAQAADPGQTPEE